MLRNPSVYLNWVSYLVGEYLCGGLSQSINTLNAFQKSMSKNLSKTQLSEILLFKARVLSELGNH